MAKVGNTWVKELKHSIGNCLYESKRNVIDEDNLTLKDWKKASMEYLRKE